MDIDAPQDSRNFNSDYMDSNSLSGWQLPRIESSKAEVDDRNVIDRFVTALDQLDRRVEKLRKDAFYLQEKRDFLLMSIDLIKNNELLEGMNEHEREDISCYIHRVNDRLSTVELNVRTIRDTAQEDSLHQVNVFIDTIITNADTITARQQCQSFLNACSGSECSFHNAESIDIAKSVFVDKKFENALLGCTLDDQKNIKKRLVALMSYLNKQMVSG